jgi:four helix bundle protein
VNSKLKFTIYYSLFTISEMTTKQDISERTFAFAQRVVRLCRAAEHSATTRVIIGQLLRAATSVGANVEEAQAGQSRADFLSKMSIACKEAREANYWLRLLIAVEIFPATRVRDLLDESTQLVAILTAIVKNTKAKNSK